MIIRVCEPILSKSHRANAENTHKQSARRHPQEPKYSGVKSLEQAERGHKLLRLQITHSDVSEALHYVQLSRKNEELGLSSALLGMAVVCYARPFSGNEGTGKLTRLRLSDVMDSFTDKCAKLHCFVRCLRNKVIAHSDGESVEIVYTPIAEGADRYLKGCLRKKSVLLDLRPQLDDFETLIQAVRSGTANRLNALEASMNDLPYPAGGWS